jgi:4-alpha-glucanotransferase
LSVASETQAFNQQLATDNQQLVPPPVFPLADRYLLLFMSNRPQFDRRASGILLHVTSLPGPHGSGDLGPAAHQFVDFLAAAGQRWWQMLPVVPPGIAPGFSPYSALSAFAGSPWLISLAQLAKEGLLSKDAAKPLPSKAAADFARVLPFRDSMLRLAYESFKRRSLDRADFEIYCEREQFWLDDWSLFAALKTVHGEKMWFEWESGIRLRKPAALRAAHEQLANEIDFHRFVQYQFDRQWKSLQKHCQKKGVGLLGDLPIFVAADSAEVWAHRELFALDSDGRPASISGCPPDFFCDMGQIWRHPQYRWASHKKDNFAWWVSRFAMELSRFDGVRVDHFLGFYRTWAIPGDANDGRIGKWLMSPGRELFAAVKKAVGEAPIIAEDLGVLIPAAAALRDELGLPGMRVMQFGFTGENYYLPHNYVQHSVAYTGTHDNNTVRGWFALASKAEREKALAYLGASPDSIHRDMVRALMESVAQTVIVPMQDVLGLGNDARMNYPGTEGKNWRWRLTPAQLTPAVIKELLQITTLCERA